MDKRYSQQEEIERLFTDVRNYRNSDSFRELITFCAKFKQLSPYNAWMAQLQCPMARFLLTEKEWRNRYNRKLCANARPIIILVPFGPIGMVFDISDTIPVENNLFAFSNDEILSSLARPYRTTGKIDNTTLDRMLNNLAYNGIAWKYFKVAADFGAEIRVNHDNKLQIKTVKGEIVYPNDYLISVNSNAIGGEFFASLCHELGHLFCHHLPNPHAKWNVRHLSHKEEEFEAETVSWLVCERAGVKNPSEHYLAGYTDEKGDIPPISINTVLLAVGEIERMMRDAPNEALKHGLLYKHCQEFKNVLKAQNNNN